MSTCTMLASRSLRRHFVACSSENCYADDTNTKDKNSCNYRQKNTCPLKRNYLQSSLIYQATVTSKDNSTTETYIQNGVCKVYYLQNISENEEDLLSYPKFIIKRKHLLQITALSLRIFTRNSVSTKCFTRSRGAQFEHINYFF